MAGRFGGTRDETSQAVTAYKQARQLLLCFGWNGPGQRGHWMNHQFGHGSGKKGELKPMSSHIGQCRSESTIRGSSFRGLDVPVAVGPDAELFFACSIRYVLESTDRREAGGTAPVGQHLFFCHLPLYFFLPTFLTRRESVNAAAALHGGLYRPEIRIDM